MTEQVSNCSCGQPLTTGAAQGQCPKCLLKAALGPLDVPTEAAFADFAKGGARAQAERSAASEVMGAVIGRYQLLQELGEGGFGIVYLAQQTEPMRRLVALKVIKPGMDTREIMARFQAERQALALMDHPNIAQVYDGGAAENGRPYFVMELVKGVPLTQFCNEEHFNTRQRIELFLDVLAAVQHAHQKGVIHRDLKPSNILVAPHDGKPMVKVIDFGVAKALGQELTEKTLFTAHGALIGTFEYMSPEQAEVKVLDVDTRSDIYSLGVVLYELLTGRTPLDTRRLRQAGYEEIQRMIRQDEPAKPSTRLSLLGEALTEVAKQRNAEPVQLTKQIRGELDWIVMKSLEKDRVRRYETVGAFAEDLRHHLADEPVSAGPPSRAYRLRKLVRRHKGPIAAAAAVFIALLTGISVSVWQGIAATQARNAMRQEAAISRAVNDFINNDLFGAASPEQEPDRDLKVRVVLDRAAATIGKRFQDQPLVEAAIRHTLGSTYRALGENALAHEHLTRSFEIRTRMLGSDHPDSLSSRSELAELLTADDRDAEAEAEHRMILQARERVLGPEHRDTLRSRDNLAVALWSRKRFAEAEVESLKAFQVSERVFGPESSLTLEFRNTLGLVLNAEGRREEAEHMFRELLKAKLKLLGPDNLGTLAAQNNLAVVLVGSNKYPEAEAQYRQALKTIERVLGPEHPKTLTVRSNLALVLTLETQYAAAEEEDNKVRLIRMRVLGPEHPDTLLSRKRWAEEIRALGRLDEAEAESRAVLASELKVHGPEHPATLYSRMVQAACLQALNRDVEAEAECREVLRIRERDLGPERPATLAAVFYLGCSLKKQGRWEEALAAFRRAVDGRRKALGATAPETLEAEKYYQMTLQAAK